MSMRCVLALGFVFLLVASMGIVVAEDDFTPGLDDNPELVACRDECKSIYDDEASRGECIRKCKANLGAPEDVDPDFGVEPDFDKEWDEAGDYDEELDGDGGIGPGSFFWG